MKRLKMLFSSLVLLSGICQLSAEDSKAVLPVYQQSISNISLGYDKGFLGGDITLSNGLVMHINDYKYRDDNLITDWAKGNTVRFTAHSNNEALVMSVKRLKKSDDEKVEPYVVFDVLSTPKDAGLKIVDIRDGGKYIKLSDDSIWDFSWYNTFSTKHWKSGERVIVSGPDEGSNSYNFINLDAPVQKNVMSASASAVMP
jgi:hypothetical protein